MKKEKLRKLIKYVRGSEKHLIYVKKRKKAMGAASRRKLEIMNKRPLTPEDYQRIIKQKEKWMRRK